MRSVKQLLPALAAIILCVFFALPALGAEQTALEGKVNINTADAKQISLLPGIGRKTADNIVAHRTQHGSFTSVQSLGQVKGVGKKTLEKISAYIILEGESTLKTVKK